MFLAMYSNEAVAQPRSGSLGIGLQIGDPSGISIRKYTSGSMSPDFLAAWDLDDFFFLNIHGLFERGVSETDRRARLFYGPGGFFGIRDRPRDEDDDVVIGISGTVGLAYFIDRFEIYVRLTPRLSVIPDTDGDVGGGIGFRFYL